MRDLAARIAAAHTTLNVPSLITLFAAETGFTVRPTKLAAVLDRNRQGHPRPTDFD